MTYKYEWQEKQDARREQRRPVPVKKLLKIKPASVKRAKQLRQYAKENSLFLEGKFCLFPGCSSMRVTNHHSAGRQGEQLLNFKDSKILCLRHHHWVEDNPKEAKEMGLSISRLKK